MAHNGLINTISISSDNKQFLTAGTDGLIKLWSMETFDLLNEYYHGCDNIIHLSFNRELNQDIHHELEKRLKSY